MTCAPRVGLLALLLLSAPVRAEDVSGTVFELVNGQRVPAANAFVIVHWVGRRPNLWHYESVCIQAAVGRTDAQGRFAIAEPPPLRSTFLVFRDDAAIAVWKPGYDEHSRKAGEWTLAPTKASAEMRKAMADGLGSYGCSDDKGRLLPLTDPQGVLADFKRALAAESPPREEKREVRILQRPGVNPASR